jgi:hypothetical protein
MLTLRRLFLFALPNTFHSLRSPGRVPRSKTLRVPARYSFSAQGFLRNVPTWEYYSLLRRKHLLLMSSLRQLSCPPVPVTHQGQVIIALQCRPRNHLSSLRQLVCPPSIPATLQVQVIKILKCRPRNHRSSLRQLICPPPIPATLQVQVIKTLKCRPRNHPDHPSQTQTLQALSTRRPMHRRHSRAQRRRRKLLPVAEASLHNRATRSGSSQLPQQEGVQAGIGLLSLHCLRF